MSDRVMAAMKKQDAWYVPTIYAGRFVTDKAKIDGYFLKVVRPKAARIGAQIQETAAREFVYMTEAGIPAAYALRAATIHAAEVLGVDDQGVIATGKRADDIVTMPGDPLADINAVLRVDFVMRGGVAYKSPSR